MTSTRNPDGCASPATFTGLDELVWADLGQVAYAHAFELQRGLAEQVRTGGGNRSYMLLVEHVPPTITLGRAADQGNVIASPEILAAQGIEVHQTTRGGDVTYHGPGQLVGYPIIPLDRRGRDVHRYLRDVEEVIIRLMGRFDIRAGRVKGLTGVWVGNEKIAAIGIAVSRRVAYHGFALNVCPNMEHFGLIVPCGITDKPVTSMARILGCDISLAEVAPLAVECFAEVFDCRALRQAKPGELADLGAQDHENA